MTYVIKTITAPEELKQAEEIFMSHKKVMRNKVEFEKDVLFRSIISSGHILVGAFKDDKLNAFMTYKFYNQLPICQVGNIYTKIGAFTTYKFSNPENPVPKVLDYILTEIENKKYYTWYYCRANLDIYKKLEATGEGLLKWSEKSYDQNKNQYRYERYIEEIVPAMSAGKFLLHTKMFALGLWPTEIVIYKCCLRQEYRK